MIKSRKKVTKKSIFQFLKAEGLAKATDIIDGVDDQLTSSLRSHHDMKRIIDKTSYETAESIIRRVVLLGNDKKMLADWVRKNTSLEEDDIKYICRLKYKNWGRLSETFLTGIYDVDKTSGSGEMLSIIQAMRDTNENLMQLLSDRYEYAEQAARCKADNLGVSGNPREMVDDLYVSPKIRRSIWQSMRIIDEIVDIKKSAPKKIFIEVARDVNDESKKGKRTDSRKKQLIDQYKLCEREGKQLLEVIGKSRFAELKEKLESEDDSKMGKHLYLYYRQFGKCMYSGESIDISQLNNKKLYDIDHIYPRSSFSFVMLFLPYYRNVELAEGKPLQDMCFGACRLFQWHHIYSTRLTKGYDVFWDKFTEFENSKRYVDLEHIVPVVIGEIFIVAGVLLAIATIIFINKTRKIPYSASFLLFMLASIIKREVLTFYAWTDYVIISIALLMLIVDIVRLSLYIRAHKDAIHAKAADISARLKTKLQRAHKPTKDERIAELEERVKQLEDKRDE